MRCPHCGYTRKPDELCPDWQCPSCQLAYSKASQRTMHPSSVVHTRRPEHRANQPGTSSGILKSLVTIAILGCIGYFGYAIAKNPPAMLQVGPAMQSHDEALEFKKAELQAYEEALQKVEADIAGMKANVGTCPITGQPNQITITQDPRPELEAKISKLKEEIRRLEGKS